MPAVLHCVLTHNVMYVERPTAYNLQLYTASQYPSLVSLGPDFWTYPTHDDGRCFHTAGHTANGYTLVAQTLASLGVRLMYGVIGIPVTELASAAQVCHRHPSRYGPNIHL